MDVINKRGSKTNASCFKRQFAPNKSRLLSKVYFCISAYTVCFFTIVTTDDGITRPNDLTLMFAMNQFKEYCMAFVV